MPDHDGPQPCSPKQELQEVEADPSGDYEFAQFASHNINSFNVLNNFIVVNDRSNILTSNNLQTSYTQCHLGHPLIEFPGYSLAEYGPQNPAPNNDQNNWTEARFYIPQYRSPWTPPSSSEADWGWLHEVGIQPPHENKMRGLGELGPYLQVVADDENDTTPGSFSSTNQGIQQPNRHYMENSSSSAPRDTPPTQLFPGRDSDFTPDRPAAYSNCQPLYSGPCGECDALFKRPGDLQRHHDTAKAHGPVKGPVCPIGGCKYPNKRFTRVDNFKAHLVKVHKIGMARAAQHIQRWREKGRPSPLLPEGCRVGFK